MSTLAWLLPAVPLGGGAALAAAGRRANRIAPALGIASAGLTLVLAVAAWALRPSAQAPLFSGIAAGIAVDGLSAVLIVTVAVMTLMTLLYGAGEFGAGEARARFFGLMLVFAGAMLVSVTATTLPVLLFGWELMGGTSWALIGFWWRDPARVRAANVAFLTTRAADLGLYLAAGAAMAGGVRTLELGALAEARSPWLSVVTLGVIVAALGKSAQLPFSFWLARAMMGPSAVSALLHSATMVAAGAYLLLRLQPLLAVSGWGEPAVAWVGAVTALGLGLVAVGQRDLKQLLAASTSAQIGFMVLAAGAGGVAAGTAQLVAHAAVKALLFLCAGAWLTSLGTKQLPALRGAARRDRTVGVAFTIGAVVLAGLPPASLWITKGAVLASALEKDVPLYAVGVAAAVVSTVYSVRALWVVWQPVPPGAAAGYDIEQPGTRRITALMKAPLPALAVPALALGFLGLPSVFPALRALLGAGLEPGPGTGDLVLAGVLALAASLATWRWAGARLPLPRAVTAPAERWLDLERIAVALLVSPLVALSRALAFFDDRVVDGAVRSLVRGVGAGASVAGGVVEPGVDGAVTALTKGARGLGSLARRPQTGQIYQYYLQLVIALAVLGLLLLVIR